ncbi:hypothetical protein B0H14DRAFT_2639994 [Mycena olivaceomarginata]|nr:hypothetical protein B0H14DRAFT_2639994 [Mycena olivaceomarginata]
MCGLNLRQLGFLLWKSDLGFLTHHDPSTGLPRVSSTVPSRLGVAQLAQPKRGDKTNPFLSHVGSLTTGAKGSLANQCGYRCSDRDTCEIFSWTLPHEWVRTVISKAVPTAPWRFTHVCRKWRDAARGCAGLWSCIRIDSWAVNRNTTFSGCYPLAALETQLELSSGVPLDVGFFTRYPNLELPEIPLFEALVLHSNRWERLRIYPGTFSALSGIKGQLALLHRSEIPSGFSEWPDKIAGVFAVAPRLREVVLSDENFDNYSPDISLPWHQLTRVHAKFDSEFVLTNLLKARDLVDCAIYVNGPLQPSSPDTVMAFPHLRQLFVVDTWFLQSFDAPNLECLRVHYDFDSVPSFLRRSRCQLQTLKLRCCCKAYAPLLAVLQTRPHPIASRNHIRSESMFFAATAVTGANSLCPKLSSFHIQFTFDAIRSDHYDSVCDLVGARWNVVADERPLTHVHISPENAPRPACDRFEALRLAGLDVNELKEQRSHRGGWMELNPCNGFAWFPDSF